MTALAGLLREAERHRVLLLSGGGARHLPRWVTGDPTRVAIKRAAYLRRYTYAFIQMFAPHLTPEMVDKARQANAENYEL